jgi:uncharacterized protein with PQ loop repeat
MVMVRHAAAHRHVHRKKKKQPFDYVVYFFTVATPLFEVPQAVVIYRSQDASSVAWPTWVFFLLASIVFAIYTARERIWPLFVAYTLYTVIEVIIVAGIIIYS